jgi:hypothetical protein
MFNNNDQLALLWYAFIQEVKNSLCGEGGIRTRGTGLSPYDGLANRSFRPLRHLSVEGLQI